MIPVKLSIEGFYSYRQKQEICFESLTQQGLFGIFGNVGSGKSSILEAMMFALFDDSERLNKSGDDRYYNMLNLQSNAFHIDFQFRAGTGNQQLYRMVCLAKRNSRRFEDVKGYERHAYQWQGNQWLPLPDLRDASPLLGMDYRHFRQTVIIPQGKFRDFIDQTSGDRTKMLKELFQLQQYDLGPQTGSLLKRTEMDMAGLNGQLEGLGDASEENLKAVEDEIAALQQQEKSLEKECKQLQEKDASFRQLQQLFEELDATRRQLKDLEEQADVYQKREERLKLYTKAYTHFHQRFAEQKELLAELKQKKLAFEAAEKQQETAEAAFKEQQENFTAAKSAYDGRDAVRKQCDDLERVCQIKEKDNAYQQAQQGLKQAEAKLETTQKESQQQKEQLLKLEAALSELEEQQPNEKVLAEVKSWLQEKSRLEEQLKLEAERQEKIRTQQTDLLKRRNQSLNGFSRQDADWEKLIADLQDKKAELEQAEEAAQHKLQQEQVKARLAAFADNLQEGEACPLCGATEHPEPAHALSAAEHLRDAELRVRQLKQHLKEVLAAQQTLHSLHAEHRQLDVRLQECLQTQEKQQKQVAAHQQAFAWPEYEGFDLPTLKQEQAKAERQLAERRQQQLAYKKAKEAADQLNNQLDQHRLLKEQHQRQFDKLDAEIATLKQGLSEQHQRWIREKSLPQLQESLQRGRERFTALTKDYEQAQQLLNQAQEAWHTSKARIKALSEQLLDLQQKAEKRDQEIDQLCAEKGFADREHVAQTLAFFHDRDPDGEQKKIDAYHSALNQAKGQLNQLSKKTESKHYRPEEHELLRQSLKEKEEGLKLVAEQAAQARQRKTDIAAKLKQQGALRKQLEKLQERHDNLKVLAGLFRGNGFVDYVSGIRLQDLCRTANERFFRLTRNNLSLELDEKHNFIVRDYLNEGRTRLLKTLSGGQSFQAALCLALAMAEHVKSLNQAEQSFFFLDEGFGALDKENLRIVFETLKSLRQENRIVGIISHVEELQQEIDLYLKIENSPEHGSQVKTSWA